MNEQAFTIRPATANDAAAIKALIRQSGINPLGLDWSRFVLAVEAGAEWKERSSFLSNSPVVGCVQLKPHGDGSVELASLAVVPEWQGRGVARALIEHMLEGYSGPLYLMCRAGLGPLYEKFGFHAIAVEQMPPFFRRIARLMNLLAPLRPGSEGLLIMLREGNETNG
jgi:N-acetylglutamate synthase-like GNAT family acetyltransferase